VSAFSEPAAAAIVQSIWQETAIGLALWAVLQAMRHATANARYAVSCAGLAAMLLVPVATFVDALSGLTHASPSSLVQVDPRGDVTLVMANGSRIWTNRAIPSAGVLSALYGAIVPVWLAGALLASIRLLWAAGYVRTVCHGGAAGAGAMVASVNRLATSLGVRRRIAVIVTPRVASPATIGWIKPVILLPPVLITGLSSTQLEAIIAHELAHIRRHDYVVNLLQMVVETVLFYHPAVWWMSRQIRVERELCCDDVAVRATGNPADYAHALAAVARHAVTAAALGAGGPSLPHRVRRLLATSEETEHAGAGGLAITLFVLAFVGGAAAWVHGQTPTTPREARATLSLTVLDPLGQPAAGIPLVFEQGAFQAGSLFGHGFTDREGRYTISLPAGTYLFSALVDFFPPTEVTFTPGTRVERTVRMELEPMTGAFTVCIDCRESIVPATPSVAEDLQRDREDYTTALARTAEPADGWEQYRVAVPASLRRLGRSVAGSVTVAGRVGIDGRLKDLRAVSSAHPALSEAAVGALGAQRWLPARVRSTAVEIDVLIDLDYVWEGDQ
jgi:beta-lactamase regulating signal transducer with metallopeptidase domain